MKISKQIIFLTMLSIAVNGYAQLDLGATFSTICSGHNVLLNISKTYHNNEIGGGLRININRIRFDIQNNVYFHVLNATKPIHYFGADLFYHRYIFNKGQIFKPFFFYDCQFTYAPIRNKNYLISGDYRYGGNVCYLASDIIWGPYFWVEQNIGIGFKVKIYKNLYLMEKIGLGVSMIIGDDVIAKQDRHFMFKPYVAAEYGYLIQTGILYRFNEKEKKEKKEIKVNHYR